MSTAARDYALPIDGHVHHIPCGPGKVLSADLADDHERLHFDDPAANCQVAYLWVQQGNFVTAGGWPTSPRYFTSRVGRDPWPPAGAAHIASLRGHDEDGLDATIHILEVLP